MRRQLAALMSAVVTAGLIVVVESPTPAAAAGPSVELPGTPSVPVSSQSMAARPTDPATAQAAGSDWRPSGSQGAGAGRSTATSLSPSATWNVSGHTGDFQWSYPLRVPPVPGGLVPSLTLSYRSSTVDGRTSATNNQPSWVGDGWDLHPGFVERAYGSCAEDDGGGTVPPENGDLCWRSDNATALYSGGGGVLVGSDRTGWRQQQDDGSRIERLTGAGNGDNNGEHWKITTVNGTQYFFGSRPESKSTWTVPVYGDDAGEQCNGGSFTASRCTQAWRWNLDKVVDANGNQILFTYQTELNSYGANLEDAAVEYVRGGWLERVDYGLHTTAASAPAARVQFAVADRCIPGTPCTVDRPESWPDTPLTERCVTATCRDRYSPTFWTGKRLASVTTQVWRGDRFTDVDRWTLEQQYPDPGDREKPALWLRSITHTGLVGGSTQLEPVTFEGQAMPNRVYKEDGLSPLLRYRIIGIVSESGGLISVNYEPPNCVPGQTMPANAHTNALRCFPVTWSRPHFAERTDWFHKYVVSSVALSDRISSSLTQETRYEYLDGAAWRYDTSEFTPDEKRTWNEFRGYSRVRIRNGRASDPGGPITMTEHRFYRGMDGDRLTPTGGTRPVSFPDPEDPAKQLTDHDWLAGLERETTSYLGESATVVEKTLTDPVWQGPTAARDHLKAYLVRPGTVRKYTTLDGDRPRRVTQMVTSYDDRGQVKAVDDLGDTATAEDDLCTRTTYVRNTDAWVVSLPSEVTTVSARCEDTPSYPDDAVSGRRFSYDGAAWGAAPRAGNVSRVEVLAEHPASGPVYKVEATNRHDAHGRFTARTDALNRTIQTAYTPELGGPTTQTVLTNPAGHATTTVFEPAFGQTLTVTDVNGSRADTKLDPLGRVVEMWTPDRPKGDYPSSYRFSYQVRRDAPTVVTATVIGPNGIYTSTNQMYDGLLRPRQTQAPAPGGGRLLTDTRYDSQGRVYKSTGVYFNDAPVDTNLWLARDADIPGHVVTTFDGAGRPAESIAMGGAVPLWRSTTRYGGDRSYVTPPPGGTATSTVTDARRRTVELHQYHGGSATPGAPSDVTRYTYTPANHLATVADPAGNTWRIRYDLRGRRVATDDPDKGKSSFTYDEAGQLATTTDSRGQAVSYAYDNLGRPLSRRAGAQDGRLLASWTYDTVRFGKGRPATATSYDAGGNAYTSTVLSYTASYQPRRMSLTIPEAVGLGKLAGVYESTIGYNPDGSFAGESYPRAGELFQEEVQYGYDDFGRPLTTQGGPVGSTVWYASRTDYTKYGELHRLHLGSGTKRAWLTQLYDDHTRRINRTIVDAELPRPMQADLHYRYDPAGNVTSIADTALERPADNQCFRYDYLRRLTQAWTPTGDPETICAAEPEVNGLGGPAPYWQSFTYDVVGNRRTQVQHAAAGDTTGTYAYPAPGQPRPHAVSSVTTAGGGTSTTQYEYDNAGNTTVRGDQRFDWDEQGRLAAATNDDKATSFVYDADGGRLIRKDPTGATLYLGKQEIRWDQASGALTGTRYYSYGSQPVAVRTSAGVNWLFSDHHGTAQIAVDSASLTATVRRHDPFGNPRGAKPTTWPGERGFVGGTTDESTGLTHLGAREYDPLHGRFISVDPIMDLNDPQQLNGYSYANNNPTTLSDPDGLKPDWCGIDASCYGYNPHTGCPYGCGTPANEAWGESMGYDDGRPKSGKPPSSGSGSGGGGGRSSSCPPDRDCRTPAQKAADESYRRGFDFEYLKRHGVPHPDTDPRVYDLETILEIVDMCAIANGEADCDRDFHAWALDLQFKRKGYEGGVLEFMTTEGLPSGRGRGAGGVCRRSFSADTHVLMADGTSKPISEIEPGDRVLATDPETGERSAQTVTAVWVHDDTLVKLQLEQGAKFTEFGKSSENPAAGAKVTVTTTHDHVFWNETDRHWEPASDLDPGDELLTDGGDRTTVVGIVPGTEHKAPAYNLSVTNLHTYYVLAGDNPVLVHNDDKGWTPDAATEVRRGGPFGEKYYRMPEDRTGTVYWWSKDVAGHGGSKWKIYTETATGLEWYADADKNGTYIKAKHKGETGMTIDFDDLRVVNQRARGC